jgi:two-component system, NtrC family, sensor kinase
VIFCTCERLPEKESKLLPIRIFSRPAFQFMNKKTALIYKGILFVVCMLGIRVMVAAQNIGEPIYVSELKSFHHNIVDTLWRYRAGDNTAWTGTDFNDSSWQLVNSQDLLDTAGKTLNSWNGSGWFRKWIVLPDTLRGSTLAILMGHVGISEIYLDGKLIKRYGNENGNSLKAFIPHEPFFIKIDSLSRHLFAVHFTGQKKTDFSGLIAFPGFRLLVSSPTAAELGLKRPFQARIISLSFMVAFFLFFCFVYAFYPDRIASLLAALFLADFCIIFLTILIGETSSDGIVVTKAVYWWVTAVSLAGGLNLLFTYAAYYGKLIPGSWVIVAFMFLNVIVSLKGFSIASTIIGVVFTLETYRIIILGLKNNKTGFWILAIANFLILFGSNLVIFNRLNLFPPYPTTLHTLLSLATDLTLPLYLALHLAWEFGSANRDLRVQLAQVNKLSLENISKEQEKQQLLASQNESLEKQVKERTVELTSQKNELQTTLENLKETQSLLIQSEKMASLGEMTAGIAHEIQNPLNFVNNFSEVNTELIDELQSELKLGKTDEAFTISDDIKENERKINHHGKRADAIVKSMLLHSQSSARNKEATDINALIDEYLRLAYHGLRAKEKSFHATLGTDYDKTIGSVPIIPQDIGRVFLNLFNNSFYALNEKIKQRIEGYDPIVHVSTKNLKSKIEIRVKDNGIGIPKKILDKIFQPFFTSKPAGQGTGLGLSLSYDIIKAHSGEIKVESTDGEGSLFIIQIPVI